MRFYYENQMGDSGYFTTKKTEIVKAILSAWNIDADLYIVKNKVNYPLFFPYEDNEISNEYLKEYNLKIVDGEIYREIRYLDNNKLAIESDDYSNVIQLI